MTTYAFHSSDCPSSLWIDHLSSRETRLFHHDRYHVSWSLLRQDLRLDRPSRQLHTDERISTPIEFDGV